LVDGFTTHVKCGRSHGLPIKRRILQYLLHHPNLDRKDAQRVGCTIAQAANERLSLRRASLRRSGTISALRNSGTATLAIIEAFDIEDHLAILEDRFVAPVHKRLGLDPPGPYTTLVTMSDREKTKVFEQRDEDKLHRH
jgi:hypothetical protein